VVYRLKRDNEERTLKGVFMSKSEKHTVSSEVRGGDSSIEQESMKFISTSPEIEEGNFEFLCCRGGCMDAGKYDKTGYHGCL
jgi:hypothetical protein